jgi:hypothetical protein
MRRVIAALGVLAIAVGALVGLQTPSSASAANALLFNPGYIISDAAFYDGGTLTGAQVQSVLVAHNNNVCTSGGTCLKNYAQKTPTIAPTALCPGGYAGVASERAADIIAKVGVSCNISQRVLIVLLEKEQGLISSTNPTQWAYDHATGFGCPDTAPCDPAFAGFFYQVYNAARQFQNYAQNPTWWNYQPGRVNSILFNPNRGCGASNVYIQNKATAALYIYTPYQPNAAALANLYGTGDGCSTYGNRNFWRIFTDWFGSPIEASSLLRTPNDSTVYLVANDQKYPIGGASILAGLAPLGTVAYVSARYLNSLPTAHAVGRSLRDPGGTIYFYDAGIKLPFTTCQQALDYGASCEPTGYVQLNQIQSDAFRTGPRLTSVLGTTSGARYYIKNGTKSEILDAQSQANAGITAGINVLTDNAVSQLTLVPPIVRDTFALTRGTNSYSLIAGGTRYPVAAGSAAGLGVSTRTTGTLTAASMALLTAGASTFTGIITVDGALNVLSSTGRYVVTAGVIDPAAATITVPDSIVASYPLMSTIGTASFIKSPSNGTVYVVMPDDIRPIGSWDALIQLTPTGNPQILTVGDSVVALFPKGPIAINSGSLARSPGNATVYLVNGVTNRLQMGSFVPAVEAGLTTFRFIAQDRIDGYPLSTQTLGFGIVCGADKYVSAGGRLHLVAPALASLYPFDYVTFDPFLCARMTIGTPANHLIRTPDGVIYFLDGGVRKPVGSPARQAAVAPGETPLNVVPEFAKRIPLGPAA